MCERNDRIRQVMRVGVAVLSVLLAANAAQAVDSYAGATKKAAQKLPVSLSAVSRKAAALLDEYEAMIGKYEKKAGSLGGDGSRWRGKLDAEMAAWNARWKKVVKEISAPELAKLQGRLGSLTARMQKLLLRGSGE
jgi:hypothetical protein